MGRNAFLFASALAGFAALAVACGESATAAPTPTPVPERPPTTAATPTHEPAPTPSPAPAGTPLPTVVLPRIPASSGAPLLLDEVVSRGDRPFIFGPEQMQPGQSARFTLSVLECCVVVTEVDAQVAWSASPATGAAIDADTGVFSVAASTKHGDVFTITADVESGRFVLSARVDVFIAQANPLVGYWREEETGNISELLFQADGAFSVTWIPIEIYKDYWGTYTFDLSTGSLELTKTGSYRISPTGFEGGGLFSIDDEGKLMLTDIYLGSYDGASNASVLNCGHTFSRR